MISFHKMRAVAIAALLATGGGLFLSHAQPVGLHDQRASSSAVSTMGLRVVVPFGHHQQDRLSQQPRIGLSLSFRDETQERWLSHRSTELGFTFSGDGFVSLGEQTFSFEEFSARMSAEAEESGGGSATGILIGAAVVVGLGVVLLREEIDDSVDDCVERGELLDCVVPIN